MMGAERYSSWAFSLAIRYQDCRPLWDLPSLQNCAFVVVDDPIRPFTWAFEMLMLGSGVGLQYPARERIPITKGEEQGKGVIRVERK